MTTESFDELVRVVVASSVSDEWTSAVREWRVTALEEDPAANGVCVCGQTGLVKLFTIANDRNGIWLRPIGSVCVNQFGVQDLNRQVTLFTDLLKLRTSIRDHENITLTSGYFSRAILEYLYLEGAFPPDQWNSGDGEKDYIFLLNMFNKRDKESITSKQGWKIVALLRDKILPFVLAHERLR